MKKILLINIIICAALATQGQSQNKLCSFIEPQLRNVYVFSIYKNYTSLQLYGEQAPEQILNRQYITTESQRCETDSMVLSGVITDGIFIYPSDNPNKTIRFCTVEEYMAALKNKIELKIEEK